MPETGKEKTTKNAGNRKSSVQQQVTSSSALNTKDSIRDYKTITSSTSTNFNKIEAGGLERGDSTVIENPIDSPTGDDKKGKIKRNSSLISLKSINQNLKAMLKITRNDTSSSSDAEVGEIIKKKQPTLVLNPPLISAPSLRIDDVEFDETKMLLNYPQSPQRYFPSSSSASVTPAVTPTTSTTPLLQYAEYVPRSVSPSPYLSIAPSPRRSSTSDILNKKPAAAAAAGAPPPPPIAAAVDSTSKKSLHGGSHSGSGSALVVDPNLLNVAATRERRPSTSELLRKARERKGSEGKLGRSISSGSSIARCGGNRNRRLSMAF
jgi:hypothetical protein